MGGSRAVAAIVLIAAFAVCASPDEGREIARRLAANPHLRAEVMLELANHLEHFEWARQRSLSTTSGSGSASGSSSGSESGSGSALDTGSASGSGSGSGSGSDYPPHTFFALTCDVGTYPGPLGHECTFLDWSWYGCWVIVIIFITIVIIFISSSGC